MKNTHALLAITALVAAGCSDTDYSTQATSPWQQQGLGGGPNPITRTFATEDSAEAAAPVEIPDYTFYKKKNATVGANTTAATAPVPEDPSKLRVTGIKDDYALFSFVCAEKPALKSVLNIHDNQKALAARVVLVDGDTVVVEVLPGFAADSVPKVEVGGELTFSIKNAPPEPAAPGVPAPAQEPAPPVAEAVPVEVPAPVAEPVAPPPPLEPLPPVPADIPALPPPVSEDVPPPPPPPPPEEAPAL